MNLENCSLLKESRTRKILCCPAEACPSDSPCLVKIYFYPGTDPLRYLFRKSKARLEYETAREIEKRGVPTLVPEKTGEVKKLGVFYSKSILVTRMLQECLSLEELFSGGKPPDEGLKRQIIRKYAELARLIHDSGIYQEDFAAYNILYQKNSSKGFKLYFLDFEKINTGRELSFEQRARNLAKLNRSARSFISTGSLKETDRIRFLKAYLGARSSRAEMQKWIAGIQQQEENIFRRDKQRTRKKSTSESSRIGVFRHNEYHGYYRKRHREETCYTRSDIIRIIQAVESKASETGLPGEIPGLAVDLNGRQERFQVLFFQGRGLKYSFKRMFKKTPLVSAWKSDDLMLRNRTAGFLPAAAVEKRTGPADYLGFLVRKI